MAAEKMRPWSLWAYAFRVRVVNDEIAARIVDATTTWQLLHVAEKTIHQASNLWVSKNPGALANSLHQNVG